MSERDAPTRRAVDASDDDDDDDVVAAVVVDGTSGASTALSGDVRNVIAVARPDNAASATVVGFAGDTTALAAAFAAFALAFALAAAGPRPQQQPL